MTKKNIVLVGFIALKFFLQYHLISPQYDLHRDEYLHLDQGNHLAWGFVSVPPFNSWIAYIIYLLGNSFFWIKFFPALFGALTILVVWKTIEELNGNLFALILGATCVLFSVLLRLNILFQPNSFDVLCWTTFYFIVIKFIKTENTKWLFIGAVILGIGFLNKYNIVFLVIGLLPSILLSEHRKVFFQPALYGAILLALAIVLPNLIWQFKNGFPVIHHLKLLADIQLVNVNRLDFLKSQMLFFVGSCFVIFSALYALIFYKPFEIYRIFFGSIIFTLIVFICLRAKDYYAIGIYPIYISFGSVFLAEILKEGWKKYLRPVAIVIPIILFIPFYNIGFPTKSPQYIAEHQEKYQDFGLLRWEDGKDHLLPQDFADMLGWKELAFNVDSIYSGLPNKTMTLVLCDNYGQAGAINYYTQQNLRAVSFHADYVNWFDLTIQYKNLIRVKELNERDAELQETSPYFKTSIVADSITNQYAREYGTLIFAFIGSKVDINKRIKEEIAEEKNNSR